MGFCIENHIPWHWLFGKNTLHIETSQIQGIPGFLDVHIPGFKDQEILRKRIELSNYDELIPNMSNLVKNRLHQETFRSSIWFLADSRYDGIFEFYIHNEIPSSGKNTINLDIVEKKRQLEDFRNNGSLEFCIEN